MPNDDATGMIDTKRLVSVTWYSNFHTAYKKSSWGPVLVFVCLFFYYYNEFINMDIPKTYIADICDV